MYVSGAALCVFKCVCVCVRAFVQDYHCQLLWFFVCACVLVYERAGYWCRTWCWQEATKLKAPSTLQNTGIESVSTTCPARLSGVLRLRTFNCFKWKFDGMNRLFCGFNVHLMFILNIFWTWCHCIATAPGSTWCVCFTWVGDAHTPDWLLLAKGTVKGMAVAWSDAWPRSRRPLPREIFHCTRQKRRKQ